MFEIEALPILGLVCRIFQGSGEGFEVSGTSFGIRADEGPGGTLGYMLIYLIVQGILFQKCFEVLQTANQRRVSNVELG